MKQHRNPNTNPLLNPPLRRLKPGEFSYVERVFTENNSFSFTGTERIESIDDVVYIFKKLEDSSVENVFMVFVKDNIPIVQHLSIGGYCSAVVNTPAILESYKRLSPDRVYFVHNHPSGALKASFYDQRIFQQIRNIFKDKLQTGIIINTRSGKYGIFTENEGYEQKKQKNITNEVPIKIYSFNKYVFSKDYHPAALFQVNNHEDVASFINSHRLGERKKVSILVLNQDNKIVGNFFTNYTVLTNKNVENLSNYIVRYINRFGGINAILFGNFYKEPLIERRLKTLIREKSAETFNLLDIINCKEGCSITECQTVQEGKEEYLKQNKKSIHSTILKNIDNEIKREGSIKNTSDSSFRIRKL